MMKHKQTKIFTAVCLKLLLSLITLLLVFTGCGVGKEQTDEPKVQSRDTTAPINETDAPYTIENIPTETVTKIKEDYITRYQYKGTADQCSIFVHGIYNDAYVMYIFCKDAIAVETGETVAGIHFVYSSPHVELKVYQNGDFCSLTQAYENQVLTADNIQEIYGAYTSKTYVKY